MNSTTEEQSVALYTNSIIDINIPDDPCLPDKILFEWSTSGVSCPLGTSNLYELVNKNTPNVFICSPLNYGSNIRVCIKEHDNDEVIDEMEYGPIELERALVDTAKYWKSQFSVKAQLNKTQMEEAKIKLLNTTSQVKINLQANNHHISINISQSLKNNPSKGILRIYATEANCLGFYIYHEIGKLMEFLKQFKICCHYGHYLKVYFQDRLTRDIMICQLMRKNKCKMEEVDKILESTGKRPKINVKLGEVKNQKYQSIVTSPQTPKLPEEPKLIAPPNVLDKENMFLENTVEKTKKNNQKNDGQANENIVDDIYNILYTPMSNYSKQEELKNFNFQTGQSMKSERRQKATLKSQHVEPVSSLNKEDAEYKKKAQLTAENFLDSESAKTVKHDYNKEYPYITFKKSSCSVICGDEMNELQDTNTEVGLTTRQRKRGKSPRKESYDDRIQELMKINEELVRENTKLKEQNRKLKEKEPKPGPETQIVEVSKMLEIKTMVQAMAKRLQVLEDANQQKPEITPQYRKPPQYQPYLMQSSKPQKERQQKKMFPGNYTNSNQIPFEQRQYGKKKQWNFKRQFQKKDEYQQEKEERSSKYISPTTNYQRFINKNYQPQPIPQIQRQSPEAIKRLGKTNMIQSPQHTQNAQLKSPINPISSPINNQNKLTKPQVLYFQN